MKYYFDTCIWRDFFEGRYGQRGKPLGFFAFTLLEKILKTKSQILYSAKTMFELRNRYSAEEVAIIFNFLQRIGVGKIIHSSEDQMSEARIRSEKYGIPRLDALHAILARDNGAILVTRDHDFDWFTGELMIKKPEDL